MSRTSSFCRDCVTVATLLTASFHLLVVALVGLRDQLIDFAGGNLRQDAVALADGQQDGIEHLVDALDHGAVHPCKLARPAALREVALFRGIHEAQDLLRDQHGLVLGCLRPAVRVLRNLMSIRCLPVHLMAVTLPALADSCCRHRSRSFLSCAGARY